MKALNPLLSLVVVCGLASGATLQQAQSKLDSALKELGETKSAIAKEMATLTEEVELLDEKALKLSRTAQKLELDQIRLKESEQKLQQLVDARGAEFQYVNGVLKEYVGTFDTRISPAEDALYEEALTKVNVKVAAAGDDVLARTTAQVEFLNVAADRLLNVANGFKFEGKAMDEMDKLQDGKFVLVGPSAYFASNDGKVSGVVVSANLDTKIPEVLSIDGLNFSKAVMSGGGEMPLDPTQGNAIRFEKQAGTDWISGGGRVGYVILLLGLISIGLAIYKCIQLSTTKFPSMKTVNDYIDALLKGNNSIAEDLAARQGAIGQAVMTAGIENFRGKRSVLEEMLYEKVAAGRPALERFLPFLSLTAAAAPLLGLLGTVLGIIKTFQVMAVLGNSGDNSSFTQGISEALVTTAQGLIVAIPVLIMHGMLRAYVKAKMGEAELVSIAIINGQSELKK